MIEASDSLMAEVAAAAEVHDRLGHFTDAYVKLMRDNGMFDLDYAATEDHLTDYLARLTALSSCCPSTAFIVHMHHCATLFLGRLVPGREPLRAVLKGTDRPPIFCSLNSEPGMHYRRQAYRTSQVTKDARGAPGLLHVQAKKHFCSGVRIADFAFSLVGDREARRSVALLLRLDADGVEVGPPFELMGLRATDSRSVTIDMLVPQAAVFELVQELPTHVWGLGYAAILQGIGVATVDALRTCRDAFKRDGRWGEWETCQLGRLIELRDACAAILNAAAGVGLMSDSRPALVAKLQAEEFATMATRAALRIVGGESAALYSSWSRRYRDATTLGLLPPGVARSLSLLGTDIPAMVVDVAIPVE